MIEQALILAAGKGTRLRESRDALPKPLTEVRGVPLVKRTIQSLAAAGVKRVVIVTGFMADQVRAAIESDASYRDLGVTITFVHNPDFERSNGISVLVGGRVLEGPFMLSMADHVYTPAIARGVGSSDLAAADLYLATDTRIDQILDLDDATKVRSEAGRIVAIGKQLTDYDRIDCGVFAVTGKLLDALDVVRAERGDCSLTDGVRRLAEQGRARVCDIGEEWWQDVDTPADLSRVDQTLR
ncbi:MAG TPA: NTP transferase domain-containing protein [Kofleriaceae bacterium]